MIKSFPKEKRQTCSEAVLWDTFSLFIRLRDADENGICRCFTCGRVGHWKTMDAGHGIPRQHKATKYHEQNNHAQCKKCNGFEGGMREAYKEEMNKRYGAGSWDKMFILSKTTTKRSGFEFYHMNQYYKNEVKKLMEEKKL